MGDEAEEIQVDHEALLRAAILGASEEYDADIYLYSGEIGNRGLGLITRALSLHKIRPNVLLILTTNGGSANIGYQIARILQKTYDNFILYCPSVCKSAGTLMALGADKLIMDLFSELGPLDVQLFRPNEIFSRKSGLTSKSAFEALREEVLGLYEHLMLSITSKSDGNISFKLASELSANMTSSLLCPIYEQINPEVLGGEHRDLDVAFHYGTRLVENSDNADAGTVYHLVHHYPSHDFIIDDEEAKGMFKSVDAPSEHLYTLAGYMGDVAYDEADPTVVRGLTPEKEITGEKDEQRESEEPREGSSGSSSSSADGHAVDEGREPDRDCN